MLSYEFPPAGSPISGSLNCTSQQINQDPIMHAVSNGTMFEDPSLFDSSVQKGITQDRESEQKLIY